MGRRLAAAAVFVAVILSANLASASSRYAPVPQGAIGLSRPTIGQRWDLTDGDRLVDAEMWLDGQKTPVTWDPSSGWVAYTPRVPLGAGPHHVKLVVQLDPSRPGWYYKPDVSEFDFTVAPGAVDVLPGADLEAAHTLAYLNGYRRAAELAVMSFEPALGLAAQMHAQHLAADPTAAAHEEAPGSPYFTGVEPWHRAAFYGYQAGGVWEVVTWVGGGEAAVDNWLATLYHRIALVKPGNTDFGYGHGGPTDASTPPRTRVADVIDCGPGTEGTGPGVSLWPYPGQTEVPTSWSGGESPDPFRLYPGASRPVGYTITATWATSPDSLTLSGYSLAGPEGEQVQVYTYSPETDDLLKDTVALIPSRPLEPDTIYTVTMSGSVDAGSGPKSYSQRWVFTTGSGQLEVGSAVAYRSWTLEGGRITYTFNDQLQVRDGLRVFIGGLPVRDLGICSRSELTFVMPLGLAAGPVDLRLVSDDGQEVGFGLPEGYGPTEPSQPFTETMLPLESGKEIPALRYLDGSLLVPAEGLAGLGALAAPFSDILRTYWTLRGHSGCVTLGSAFGWVDGGMVVVKLPPRQIDGLLYVPAEFVLALLQAAASFPDVAGHWAEDAIARLTSRGIVSGYDDGTFRPNGNLTRAAFVKMLVLAKGLELRPGGTGAFADTASHWVATQGFLGPALDAGIIAAGDYPDACFRPDQAITREEIAVMVVRALGLEAEARDRIVPTEGGRATIGARVFSDASSWARAGFVAVAIERGIVTGYAEPDGTNTFRPRGKATRAEAAVMLGRMLDRAEQEAGQ